MKKLFYGTALLVVVGVSFAFLPKEGESAGYMMVFSKVKDNRTGQLAVISTDGNPVVTNVELTGTYLQRRVDFHKAELAKINELSRLGYVLISTTSSLERGSLEADIETAYVLRKQ